MHFFYFLDGRNALITKHLSSDSCPGEWKTRTQFPVIARASKFFSLTCLSSFFRCFENI